MNDIDTMDLLGFLKIRAWKASQETKHSQPKHRYIDEVWKNMTPTL